MKSWRLAAVLAGACLLAVSFRAAAADDAPLFRVFLKDGSTLVSYGEFARVGDRVVFSMPLNADTTPVLHLVNIPAEQVDWARTNRYSESLRASRYLATRAESDYVALTEEVARTLNEVAHAGESRQRLALVEKARKTLGEWPQNHFNYRSGEVRQMLAILDDAIADLRAATGDGRVNLSLSAFVGDPAPIVEPPLPAPTPKDAIEQALRAARVSDSATDRESLLEAALVQLDRGDLPVSAEWVSTARASARAALDAELQTDRAYQQMSAQVLARADRRARAADVRGFTAILAAVQERDAALGGKRREAVNSLVAAVEAKLNDARRLRLARDRWAMRQPDFQRYYLAITDPVDLFALFARIRPALEDIKALAGSTPAVLAGTERVIAVIVSRAVMISPPDEFKGAHALIVSAAQMAGQAAAIRREAVVSGNMARAWDASSAAAGALMLSARARSEIHTLLYPPQLDSLKSQ